VKIERIWAMPNKWTFQIKPIKELLERYVGDGTDWVDPFAGSSNLAEYRNDLKTEQPNAIEAIEFLKTFHNESIFGVLLDPPYSFRQLFKTYRSGSKQLTGKKIPMTEINDVTSKIIRLGGYCISFGWNTGGLGKKRGFEIEEVLLVPHGGQHNDTIVTVEKKTGGI